MCPGLGSPSKAGTALKICEYIFIFSGINGKRLDEFFSNLNHSSRIAFLIDVPTLTSIRCELWTVYRKQKHTNRLFNFVTNQYIWRREVAKYKYLGYALLFKQPHVFTSHAVLSKRAYLYKASLYIKQPHGLRCHFFLPSGCCMLIPCLTVY